MSILPRLVGLCCVLLGLLLAPSTSGLAQPAPHCGSDDPPVYVFGFAHLKSLLDATMGDPVSCEYADPNGTGDTLQDTSTGLAFWRKSTNTPTFTDGATHWGLTVDGLLTWTGASIDPPLVASAPPNWPPPARTKTDNCLSTNGLPDSGCTPGAIDPNVTQSNIQQTICLPGYTAGVRPPTSFTNPLKLRLMAAYGYSAQPTIDFELDHLISLELGGAPRDPANLWPEPWTGSENARQKDVIENFLHEQVCREALPLAAAQEQIATDWSAVRRALPRELAAPL
jgi:hypothetical protein